MLLYYADRRRSGWRSHACMSPLTVNSHLKTTPTATNKDSPHAKSGRHAAAARTDTYQDCSAVPLLKTMLFTSTKQRRAHGMDKHG
eukprot:422388-Prymnesium_polylepis.1